MKKLLATIFALAFITSAHAQFQPGAGSSGGSISYPLLAPAGSFGAPSYSFSAQTAQGIYSNGSTGLTIQKDANYSFSFGSGIIGAAFNNGAIRGSINLEGGTGNDVGLIAGTATANISFGTSGSFNFNIPTNNILELGGTAVASPVATTITGNRSRSGTDSNIGGGNVTISAGLGTGTGTASAVVIQSPLTTTSGTGAQSETTGLTIQGGQYVSTGYTVSTLPTGITGGRAHVTDAVACTFLSSLTGGSTTVCPVFYNGTAWVGG